MYRGSGIFLDRGRKGKVYPQIPKIKLEIINNKKYNANILADIELSDNFK